LSGCKAVKLSKKTADGVKQFCELVEEFEEMIPNVEATVEAGAACSKKKTADPGKLSYFVEKVVERAGLVEYHKSQDEIAGTQKTANIQEFGETVRLLYPCTKAGLL